MHMINHMARADQVGGSNGGALRDSYGDVVSQIAVDGMDDLELGPFFTNDFQRWFDGPTLRN